MFTILRFVEKTEDWKKNRRRWKENAQERVSCKLCTVNGSWKGKLQEWYGSDNAKKTRMVGIYEAKKVKRQLDMNAKRIYYPRPFFETPEEWSIPRKMCEGYVQEVVMMVVIQISELEAVRPLVIRKVIGKELQEGIKGIMRVRVSLYRSSQWLNKKWSRKECRIGINERRFVMVGRYRCWNDRWTGPANAATMQWTFRKKKPPRLILYSRKGSSSERTSRVGWCDRIEVNVLERMKELFGKLIASRNVY